MPDASPGRVTSAAGPAAACGGGGLDDAELLALPKVDLHLHLVGSAAPRTVAELAGRHPSAGVPADVPSLLDFYAFRDFAHFLEVYNAVSALLRSGQDVQALVVGLGADLAAQGVVYAEVTVTPVTHVRAGIVVDELAQALTRGAAHVRRETGVELAWVYDISGRDGPSGALATLDAALHHPPVGLVGFGLGGPEDGVRRADYRGVFAAARAAGLHSVPHAGETVGPSEIWAAVTELGAERIGHGITASRDAGLVRHLREQGIALEVCPSSNVATGAVPLLAGHPLPHLLEQGLVVTLGSDDPPMFGTSLLGEYQLARDVLGLDRAQLLAVAAAGFDASFAPAHTRRRAREALAAAGAAPARRPARPGGWPGRPAPPTSDHGPGSSDDLDRR